LISCCGGLVAGPEPHNAASPGQRASAEDQLQMHVGASGRGEGRDQDRACTVTGGAPGPTGPGWRLAFGALGWARPPCPAWARCGSAWPTPAACADAAICRLRLT